MSKEELIKWLTEQPDDIQIFTDKLDYYDCVNIKIFTKPKDKEFLKWYFGL